MVQIQPVFELPQLETGVHSYMMIVKYDHMRIVKWRAHISVVCLVEHKQNMSTVDEGRNHPREQVIEQIGCIY